jgi:hypothetical protein
MAGAGISISGTTTRTITNSAPDQTVALTNGGGIAVSGTYPNFTLTAADQSATNELQTLSIDGSDLTLSNGGGTVTLPGGADGNGIYSGDGTIPGETSATLESTGYFKINWSSGNKAIYISDDEQQLELYSPSNTTSFYANDSGIGFQVGSCYINMDGTDTNVSSPGFTYIANSVISPASYSNAAAPNNTIFYSTTDGKLSYKDPGGTVHGLY